MKLRNARERGVWDAAYAAAWVSDFRKREHVCAMSAEVAADYFDRPLSNTTAEEAITLADAAVEKLRYWRANENPKAGR